MTSTEADEVRSCAASSEFFAFPVRGSRGAEREVAGRRGKTACTPELAKMQYIDAIYTTCLDPKGANPSDGSCDKPLGYPRWATWTHSALQSALKSNNCSRPLVSDGSFDWCVALRSRSQ